MNINIKTTTVSMTDAIRNYVDNSMSGIVRLLSNDPTARFDLEIGKTSNHHKNGEIYKAEIHIIAKGQNIYSSVEKEDLYSAIDVVKDEVIRKINSAKDKKVSLLKRGGALLKKIIRNVK